MRNRKSIGGFIGLEFPDGEEYHKNTIKLNSGRNGLEYILKANSYTKIHIPYYTCDVILSPIKNNGIQFEFYSVDEKLEPIFDFNKIKSTDVFLYTNYFGLKSEYIKNKLSNFKNIIIDNAQAFYSKQINRLDTFYSPRKFFGVPDGGYVYSKNTIDQKLEVSKSYDRVKHLVKQADISIESAYSDFLKNEEFIKSEPMKQMSNLSVKILKSIDYEESARKRIENFNYLEKELNQFNLLNFPDITEAPLNYPLLLDINCYEIRSKLIENHIYCPKYWDNVLEWIPNKTSIEEKLVNNMINFPIDQRYNLNDMEYLVKTYKEIIKIYE